MTNKNLENSTDYQILSGMISIETYAKTLMMKRCKQLPDDATCKKLMKSICYKHCILSDKELEDFPKNVIVDDPKELQQTDITPYLKHTKNIVKYKIQEMDFPEMFYIKLFLIVMFIYYNLQKNEQNKNMHNLHNSVIINVLTMAYVVKFQDIKYYKEYFNKFKTLHEKE